LAQHFTASTLGPLTRWLIGSSESLLLEVHDGEARIFHGGIPAFLSAGLNTILVSVAIAWRIPTLPFIVWMGLELSLAAARLLLCVHMRRSMRCNRQPPVGPMLALLLAWASSVGYGVFLCVSSGDWAVSMLACLSAAAMAGGTCLRYYPMPRLVTVMVFLSLGPCALAALFDGEPIFLLTALQVPLYIAIMSDAASQVNKAMVRSVRAERENERRARHDSLTGLLNRAGLACEISRRTAAGERFALLYLDLDRFKAVNDNFGHQAGDELLKAVADRLRRCCRPGDAIARIGGDEFVILSGPTGIVAAKSAARRIIKAVSTEGFFFEREAAFVGASIGIAFFPDHGSELGPLLGEADAALYQAKYGGRGRCAIARTGKRHTPVDDRRPVSRAAAEERILQLDAA
jgi:diguanylate cyclase (GGDEF)-like protein